MRRLFLSTVLLLFGIITIQSLSAAIPGYSQAGRLNYDSSHEAPALQILSRSVAGKSVVHSATRFSTISDYSAAREKHYDADFNCSLVVLKFRFTAVLFSSFRFQISSFSLQESLARLYDCDYDEDENSFSNHCFLAPGSGVDDLVEGAHTKIKFRQDGQMQALLPSKGGAGPNRWQNVGKSRLEQLRAQFNSTERAGFIRDFAGSSRAKKLFTRGQRRLMMSDGVMPSGWDIHHLNPLHRGGTNAFSNLVPAKRVFHQRWNRLLHYHNEGTDLNRLRSMVERFGQ